MANAAVSDPPSGVFRSSVGVAPAVQCVGNYDLGRTIGKGQFGKVKLARHVLTKEKVAVKIIMKESLDPNAQRMLHREIAIMKLLAHPNIINLYEIIETDKVLFLIMEYAPGGEVLDYIVAHGRLAEPQARRFFAQLVSAMIYAHSMHVVHRDLKVENMLLDAEQNIKIIDFGLSNQFQPGKLLDTFCGSPTYAAPELIQKKKYQGPEVDVWSMGVILYVLVCGKLPFDANDFLSLYMKILNSEYTLPDYVSDDCRDLIGQLLNTNPQTRITLQQVRQHHWMTCDPTVTIPRTVGLHFSPTDALDEEILAYMVTSMNSVGFSREAVVRSVTSNSHDAAAATYFLLKHRVEKYRKRMRQVQRERRMAHKSSGEVVATVAMHAPGVQAGPSPSPSPGGPHVRRKAQHKRNKTVDPGLLHSMMQKSVHEEEEHEGPRGAEPELPRPEFGVPQDPDIARVISSAVDQSPRKRGSRRVRISNSKPALAVPLQVPNRRLSGAGRETDRPPTPSHDRDSQSSHRRTKSVDVKYFPFTDEDAGTLAASGGPTPSASASSSTTSTGAPSTTTLNPTTSTESGSRLAQRGTSALTASMKASYQRHVRHHSDVHFHHVTPHDATSPKIESPMETRSPSPLGSPRGHQGAAPPVRTASQKTAADRHKRHHSTCISPADGRVSKGGVGLPSSPPPAVPVEAATPRAGTTRLTSLLSSFRNLLRSTSRAPSTPIIPEPRTCRHPIGKDTPTSRNLTLLLDEVARVLAQEGVKATSNTPFSWDCAHPSGMVFELEVCQLPNIEQFYYVTLRRMEKCPLPTYTEVAQNILKMFACHVEPAAVPVDDAHPSGLPAIDISDP